MNLNDKKPFIANLDLADENTDAVIMIQTRRDGRHTLNLFGNMGAICHAEKTLSISMSNIVSGKLKAESKNYRLPR